MVKKSPDNGSKRSPESAKPPREKLAVDTRNKVERLKVLADFEKSDDGALALESTGLEHVSDLFKTKNKAKLDQVLGMLGRITESTSPAVLDFLKIVAAEKPKFVLNRLKDPFFNQEYRTPLSELLVQMGFTIPPLEEIEEGQPVTEKWVKPALPDVPPSAVKEVLSAQKNVFVEMFLQDYEAHWAQAMAHPETLPKFMAGYWVKQAVEDAGLTPEELTELMICAAQMSPFNAEWLRAKIERDEQGDTSKENPPYKLEEWTKSGFQRLKNILGIQ